MQAQPHPGAVRHATPGWFFFHGFDRGPGHDEISTVRAQAGSLTVPRPSHGWGSRETGMSGTAGAARGHASLGEEADERSDVDHPAQADSQARCEQRG